MHTVFAIMGGLGLFLLGLHLMTDGLKGLAGAGLRALLTNVVRGPMSGVATGAVVTALVQSSSATTMMTIGLVSAGLLTFTQSIGVVLGANVGTTSTGWLVAVVGLKFSITAFTMPMVFLGAMARMLGRGRWALAGTTVAGFALLFIGIDGLASGMAGLASRISPQDLPHPTPAGRLVLAAMGMAFTVITQSSSVSAAATLSALHAGAIGMDQALPLIVGQNIGTAVSSAAAAIGATTPAKRTAMAHILFNVITGVVVFLLLPVATPMLERWAASGVSPTIVLAAFHTGFNVAGLLVIAPMIGPFARVVIMMVPSKGPTLTRRLDRSVATVPAVAVEAARRTVGEVAGVILRTVGQAIAGPVRSIDVRRMREAHDALVEATRFLGTIGAEADAPDAATHQSRRTATLHASDHLLRLIDACTEDDSMRMTTADPTLAGARAEVVGAVRAVQAAIEHSIDPARIPAPADAAPAVEDIRAVSARIADLRRTQRADVLERTAMGMVGADEALARIEGLRWIDRVAFHAWRAAHHILSGVGAATPQTSEAFSGAADGPAKSVP